MYVVSMRHNIPSTIMARLFQIFFDFPMRHIFRMRVDDILTARNRPYTILYNNVGFLCFDNPYIYFFRLRREVIQRILGVGLDIFVPAAWPH